MNINSAWDSGAESSRCRKFLFCFLFIHFSKHPFYFQWAFKRKQEDSDSGIKRERRILELQSLANPFSVKLCVPLCSNEEMGRKELSPHYPALGQPKGPLTQGAKHTHYWLSPLASSLPDDTLRELCPHSNCPEFGGQKLPWEKYLIPLSHTCAVINPNMEVYFGCIFTTQRQQCRERSPLARTNEEIF